MFLQNIKKNPYYLFWIGILIGAIVTASLFAYRMYWSDFETAIFKSPTYKTQQQKQKTFKAKKQSAPKTQSSSSAKKGNVNIGDGGGW